MYVRLNRHEYFSNNRVYIVVIVLSSMTRMSNLPSRKFKLTHP